MKKLIFTLLMAICLGLFLTSCTDDNLDITTEEEETFEPALTQDEDVPNGLIRRSQKSGNTTSVDSKGFGDGCLVVLYPFSLKDNTGEAYKVEDENALYALFDLFLNRPEGEYLEDFVYPLDVIIDNKEPQTVDNGEQLEKLLVQCIPLDDWNEESFFPAYLIDETNSCYSLEYPISLTLDLDGSEIVVNNDEEFTEILIEEIVYFVFPLTLKNDQSSIEVNSIDELFNVLFSCNEFYELDSLGDDYYVGFNEFLCYTLDYPIKVILTDNTEQIVENESDFGKLQLQGSVKDFVYPISLIKEDGTAVIVNNVDELYESIFECNDIIFIQDDGDLFLLLVFSQPYLDEDPNAICYSIQYPINITNDKEDPNAEVTKVASAEELEGLIGESAYLIYPVTVILQSDGKEVVINNQEELFEVFNECAIVDSND